MWANQPEGMSLCDFEKLHREQEILTHESQPVNLPRTNVAKQNREVVLGLSIKGSKMELNVCCEFIHCKNVLVGKTNFIFTTSY